MVELKVKWPVCGRRVYLIGGAAAEGTPDDAVVVYTPAVVEDGIYMANLTLPHGTFWSDVIEPPGLQPMTAGKHPAKILPIDALQSRQPRHLAPCHSRQAGSNGCEQQMCEDREEHETALA